MTDPAPLDPVTLAADAGYGPDLVLRPATRGDAAAWAAHVAADLDHLGEHLPWPAVTADEAGAAVFIGRYVDREAGRELVAVLDDGAGIVGGTVLMTSDPRTASIELGCWIARGHEGRGTMRAACLATIRHAHAVLHVNRVVWTSATGNARSRALAERLGFRHEGTLRQAGLHAGVRQDLDVFGLVGDEIDEALATSRV